MAYDLSFNRWGSLVDPSRNPENTYNIFFSSYKSPNPNYLLATILFLIGLLYFFFENRTTILVKQTKILNLY